MKTKNAVAMSMFILGLAVIVVGVIGAIVLGYYNGYGYAGFNGTVFLIVFVGALITGFMILGFAELIKLVYESKEYLRKIAGDEPIEAKAATSADAGSIASRLPEI